MKRIHLLSFSCSLLLSACASTTAQAPAPAADKTRIEAHMLFLSDDSLEGRDTGSKGHLIASQYLASNFQQLGLKPAGDNGSYFQQVPLRQSKLIQQSPKFSLTSNGTTVNFDYPKEFTTGPSSHEGKVEVTKAGLVFVGYGLVSKEFGIDDYKNLDVKGKIVVMLPGRPDKLPSEEAAHLSSLKARLAAERGAVGVISVHTPKEEKTRPYSNSLLYLNMSRVRWLHKDGTAEGDYPSLKASAYVNTDAAKVLFKGAPESLEQIFAKIEKKEVPTGFALSGEVNFSRESEHKAIESQNVAAVLEGSDPTLKNEYVVFTAHSDHIGIGNDLRSKDKINNGLMDNAAGSAILLETARLFANSTNKPKRSILFVAVTGEEKGLLGADYFAHNPVRPSDKLVANVNLDMPVLLYPFADMIAFGANHSSLGGVVERATAKHGIKLSADPMPDQAIFTRSDHYTLVKQGVPAVFLMTGFTSQDPKQKGGDIWGKFFAKHYHKPTDDVAGLTKDFGPIRYDAGALFADINFAIGEEIANSSERPYWLKDSFFGKLFGKEYNLEK